jgi:light-regulated signal transduction histidine kinase (bacteriophytochrome)
VRPERDSRQRARHRRRLAPEKLAQLFQPFNRLGQEGNPEEGTGIGLVVCKRLVELMGGTSGWTARWALAACSGSSCD